MGQVRSRHRRFVAQHINVLVPDEREITIPHQREEIVLILPQRPGETQNVDELAKLILLYAGQELDPPDTVLVKLEGDVLRSSQLLLVDLVVEPTDLAFVDGEVEAWHAVEDTAESALQVPDELMEQWVSLNIQLRRPAGLDERGKETRDLGVEITTLSEIRLRIQIEIGQTTEDFVVHHRFPLGSSPLRVRRGATSAVLPSLRSGLPEPPSPREAPFLPPLRARAAPKCCPAWP